MEVIFLIIGIVVGFAFGVLAIHFTYAAGWLNVIKTEDGPYMYLELEKKPENMMNRSYALLKIKDMSQKNHTL